MARYLDPPPAPKPLTGPPVRGRVLVVAPHADDELIGPGGTLLLHRDGGDPIRILVLTDGTRADGNSPLPAAEYRALRESESRAVAARLRAEIEFLGFPDGARAREEDLGVLVPRLVAELSAHPPAVIYAPHPGEVHGDHHVAGVAVKRALAVMHPLSAAGRVMRGFGYEIWAPLVADVVVDVTTTMDEKLDLARLYGSQLAHTDLLHFFQGLNAYRAVYLPKGARHGEAFCELRPEGPA